jgi:outer membrane protein OmpA-like peptidoglycan-associated protein
MQPVIVNRFRLAAVLFLLSATGIAGVFASEADPRFGRTEIARERAENAEGTLLAPAVYKRGLNALGKARALAADDGNAEKISELLSFAIDRFAEVEVISLRAREVLADALAARRDAVSAGAASSGSSLWRDGENQLRVAVTRLERDRDADVLKPAQRAETAFRAAELSAIESTLFAEADKQIAIAADMNADRDAPKSFAEAERLIAEARARLVQDRYDTDEPRDHATLATHHALHAQYVTRAKRSLGRGDVTMEDLLGTWKKELSHIGELLGVVVYYDNGPGDAGDQLSGAVTDLLLAKNRLDEQVSEQQRYSMALQQEIETLQTELGGQSKARARLQAELERQERMKETVQRVEGMFKAGEAQVLRVQDRLVLRMIGVSFGSGSTSLEARHHALLGKVRTALAEFPDTPVIVEGHTDSHGADNTNLDLSRKRAEAVMQYLLKGGTIARELLTAVGYGETQPIASNESAEGRQKNRRIDVVLYPQW